MSAVVGVMYIPCRQCGRVRTLKLNLYPGDIRSAMDRPCHPCHPGRGNVHARTQATRAAALAAELAWMRDTPENAARRLGTTVSALARLFYRASMPEQARPFMRAESARRYRRKAAA